MKTYDLVFLQTALIQIKTYHCNSLQNLNMREYREFKLTALVQAIMEAQAELEKLNYCLSEEGNGLARKPSQSFHGNIKPSNVFVEYSGQNNNYTPNIIFSDRASIEKPSDDNKALANLIHELVSGLKINSLPSGKLLYHFKVKNSQYFKYVQRLVAKSEATQTYEGQHVQGQKRPTSLVQQQKPGCPGTHAKFVSFKADGDLFLNGTILSAKPYSVKYGPFPQIGAVVCPGWRCRGSSSAIWDVVLRLDHGASPLDSRLELKTSFLGKTKDSKGDPTRQVFYRSMLPRAEVGICQVSCVVGAIDMLPQAREIKAGEEQAEQEKAAAERVHNSSSTHLLERQECTCSEQEKLSMTMHAQLYGCFLKDDVYLSLCLQNFRRGSDNAILIGALPFKVKTQVRFIHGNELNQDLVRILIA